MGNWNEFTDEAIEERIDDILTSAKAIVSKLLQGNDLVVDEIKNAINKGVDLITTTQLQEWAMAIPIIIEEIVANKEAYSLTRELWNIETKQMSAKNLLELDAKKTEIENINRVSGTTHKKKEAIAQYVQSILAGMQEALWVLSNAIRKIIDVRIASGSYV